MASPNSPPIGTLLKIPFNLANLPSLSKEGSRSPFFNLQLVHELLTSYNAAT